MFTLANFARSLPKENVQIETLPSIEGRSYVTVKREEAQETIRRIFFPESPTEVVIDVPDPDVVASLNGEYSGRRHRSSRAQGAPKTASKQSETDKAAAPSQTSAGDASEGNAGAGDAISGDGTNSAGGGSDGGAPTMAPDTGGDGGTGESSDA
jgi:hypothetical protein